jgi:hypothetical protein
LFCPEVTLFNYGFAWQLRNSWALRAQDQHGEGRVDPKEAIRFLSAQRQTLRPGEHIAGELRGLAVINVGWRTFLKNFEVSSTTASPSKNRRSVTFRSFRLGGGLSYSLYLVVPLAGRPDWLLKIKKRVLRRDAAVLRSQPVWEQPGVFFLDHRITLASAPLQSIAIQDLDSAPCIVDQSGRL